MIPRPARRFAAVAAALLLLPLFSFSSLSARQDTVAPAHNATPTPTPSAEAPSVPSGVVLATVSVTDKYGRHVANLGQELFTVMEGKQPRRVAYFSDKEEPQSVGVVFDVSGSMSPLALEEGRGALVRFMQQAHQENEYLIIGFNTEMQALTDWTRDGKTIIEALNRLSRLGGKKHGTRFNDACAAGLEQVVRGPHRKQVLLLISDGQDTESKTRFSRVLEMVKRSNVIIYAVGISEDNWDGGRAWQGIRQLEEIAALSGGKAFFPSNAAEITDTFLRIGMELHTQYLIGFETEPAGGNGVEEKWRRFKVKVTPPSAPKMQLYVRSREGFYAAGNTN